MLSITVVSGRGLLNRDWGLTGKSDPYVVVHAPAPGGGRGPELFRTAVEDNTCDPVFTGPKARSEIPVPAAWRAPGAELTFVVWNSNPISDDCLGAASVLVSDATDGARRPMDLRLRPRAGDDDPVVREAASLGSLQLLFTTDGPDAAPSPTPLPTSATQRPQPGGPPGLLRVSVLSAAGLLGRDWGGKSDPYVAVVGPTGEPVVRTATDRNTCDPVFRGPDSTGECRLEDRGGALKVQCWDADLGADEILGEAVVPASAALDGGETTLPLRPSLAVPSAKLRESADRLGSVTLRFAFTPDAITEVPAQVPAQVPTEAPAHGAVPVPVAPSPCATAAVDDVFHTVQAARAVPHAVLPGRLLLRVVRGRGLLDRDLLGRSDPYVVVHGPQGDELLRTPAVPGTCDPEFPPAESQCTVWLEGRGGMLRLRCWDQDTVGRDEPLGDATVSVAEALDATPALGDGYGTVKAALVAPVGPEGEALRERRLGVLELAVAFHTGPAPEGNGVASQAANTVMPPARPVEEKAHEVGHKAESTDDGWTDASSEEQVTPRAPPKRPEPTPKPTPTRKASATPDTPVRAKGGRRGQRTPAKATKPKAKKAPPPPEPESDGWEDASDDKPADGAPPPAAAPAPVAPEQSAAPAPPEPPAATPAATPSPTPPSTPAQPEAECSLVSAGDAAPDTAPSVPAVGCGRRATDPHQLTFTVHSLRRVAGAEAVHVVLVVGTSELRSCRVPLAGETGADGPVPVDFGATVPYAAGRQVGLRVVPASESGSAVDRSTASIVAGQYTHGTATEALALPLGVAAVAMEAALAAGEEPVPIPLASHDGGPAGEALVSVRAHRTPGAAVALRMELREARDVAVPPGSEATVDVTAVVDAAVVLTTRQVSPHPAAFFGATFEHLVAADAPCVVTLTLRGWHGGTPVSLGEATLEVAARSGPGARWVTFRDTNGTATGLLHCRWALESDDAPRPLEAYAWRTERSLCVVEARTLGRGDGPQWVALRTGSAVLTPAVHSMAGAVGAVWYVPVGAAVCVGVADAAATSGPPDAAAFVWADEERLPARPSADGAVWWTAAAGPHSVRCRAVAIKAGAPPFDRRGRSLLLTLQRAPLPAPLPEHTGGAVFRVGLTHGDELFDMGEADISGGVHDGAQVAHRMLLRPEVLKLHPSRPVTLPMELALDLVAPGATASITGCLEVPLSEPKGSVEVDGFAASFRWLDAATDSAPLVSPTVLSVAVPEVTSARLPPGLWPYLALRCTLGPRPATDGDEAPRTPTPTPGTIAAAARPTVAAALGAPRDKACVVWSPAATVGDGAAMWPGAGFVFATARQAAPVHLDVFALRSANDAHDGAPHALLGRYSFTASTAGEYQHQAIANAPPHVGGGGANLLVDVALIPGLAPRTKPQRREVVDGVPLEVTGAVCRPFHTMVGRAEPLGDLAPFLAAHFGVPEQEQVLTHAGRKVRPEGTVAENRCGRLAHQRYVQLHLAHASARQLVALQVRLPSGATAGLHLPPQASVLSLKQAVTKAMAASGTEDPRVVDRCRTAPGAGLRLMHDFRELKNDDTLRSLRNGAALVALGRGAPGEGVAGRLGPGGRVRAEKKGGQHADPAAATGAASLQVAVVDPMGGEERLLTVDPAVPVSGLRALCRGGAAEAPGPVLVNGAAVPDERTPLGECAGVRVVLQAGGAESLPDVALATVEVDVEAAATVKRVTVPGRCTFAALRVRFAPVMDPAAAPLLWNGRRVADEAQTLAEAGVPSTGAFLHFRAADVAPQAPPDPSPADAAALEQLALQRGRCLQLEAALAGVIQEVDALAAARSDAVAALQDKDAQLRAALQRVAELEGANARKLDLLRRAAHLPGMDLP